MLKSKNTFSVFVFAMVGSISNEYKITRDIYMLQGSTDFSPVLKDTCAPPAVMNSTFPRCKMPANSLITSCTSSLLNCITSIAVWNDMWAS